MPEGCRINPAEDMDRKTISYKAENILPNERLNPEGGLGSMEFVRCINEKFTFV
jgi:hypothetical protein